MPIFDISVPISPEQTPTYPGDPGIEIQSWSALARGDSANVTMLHFGAHTGTHVDAPAHFIEGSPEVARLSLDTLIGEARVLEMPEDLLAVDAEHLQPQHLQGATRVLLKTRNSGFWESPRGQFRRDFTYITPEGARALVEQGVRLVGIDYLSVERFKSEDFGTHKTLLAHGVVVVEGLDLRSVVAGVYELFCLPLKIAAGTGDGAPARAALRTIERRSDGEG